MTLNASRWRQRFDEYSRALALLRSVAEERRRRDLSIVEQAGMVQFFELTAELGWKTMAAWLKAGGTLLPVIAPVQIIRHAFEAGLVEDGDAWVDAVRDRNQLSHAYDVEAFLRLVDDIAIRYLPMFDALIARIEALES